MTRRFDEAWQEAQAIAQRVTEEGFDVVLVRDLLGRVVVVINDTTARRYSTEQQARIAALVRDRCGPFAAPQPVITTSDLFAPDTIASAPELLVVRDRDTSAQRGRLAVLERGVVGREWRTFSARPAPNRVTLYGFKGGVGRSTATVVLARHLAERGCCVLAVDLDLESPGISAVALGNDDMPNHGIVDFLIEAGVENEEGLDCVGRSSGLRVPGNGEVWVAPAGGRPRPGYSYIPKLNRVYLDYPGPSEPRASAATGLPDRATFAGRLHAAVDYCAAEVERRSRQPDIVLLDSRTGMHDVAAVAITQLSDLTLLFGIDSEQTWSGYRELFQQWSPHPELVRGVRERLRMVAAMVPPATESEYLTRFRDRAQLLFSESLYDEADADDTDAFNPPLADMDAPHSPLPILFTTDLVGVDVTRVAGGMDQDFVAAAFHRFVRGAADLILEDPGGDP